MSDLYGFYLGSGTRVAELETIELSHPSFSQVYRLQRQLIRRNLVVTLEDGTQGTFAWYPLKISREQSNAQLDQPVTISFGDLGQTLPLELDRLFVADTFVTKPSVVYRTFRSDDLSMLTGPLAYELNSTSHKGEGATLTAAPPKVNLSATGEIYTLDRFTALRAL